jgi:hypothetical protein
MPHISFATLWKNHPVHDEPALYLPCVPKGSLEVSVSGQASKFFCDRLKGMFLMRDAGSR